MVKNDRMQGGPWPRAARRGALLGVLLAMLVGSFCPAAHAGPTQAELDEMKAQYVRPKTIPYPKSNPYSPAKAQLGAQLFFDPRLSGPATVSCATCHSPDLAWGDGKPTGVGHAGNRLDRRSPTILNLAWAELLFWDGRAGTLEEQAVGPIQNPDEMNQTMPKLVSLLGSVSGYKAAFAAAFPNEPISPNTIAKAIATFERAVVSAMAPFDRWIAGDENAIDEAAKRGFVLFNTKAHCSACHSGWRLTDDSFHDIGLREGDLGRGKLIPGVEILRFAFKTPGLRNIAERGPYMHNGTIASLTDVVRHYNDGFTFRPSLSVEMHRLKLNTQEIEDIVAFLQTLSSPDPVVTAPTLPN